jgi:hypothetical protein
MNTIAHLSCRPVARAVRLACAATLAVLASGTVHALDINVLGCRYRVGPPGNFIDCINDESNHRINDVRRDAENQLRERDGRIATLQADMQKARDEAEKRIVAAQRDIENGPRYAKSLAEQRVLTAARSLQLDEVFQCLERTGAMNEVLQDAQRVAQNPASLLATLDARVAQQARATMNDVAAAVLRDLLSQPRPPTSEQAVALARTLAQRVGERVPAFGCIEQHFRPFAGQFESAARAQRTLLDQRQATFFNQRLKQILEDALRRGIQQQMQDAARSAAGPVGFLASKGMGLLDVEVEGIVTRAFVKQMLIPSSQASTVQVNAYAQALAGGNPQDARDRSAATLAALTPSEQMRAAALIDIGVSVLRDVGSKFITEDYAPLLMGGGDMFEAMSKIMNAVETGSFDVDFAIAGLVPEGGAAAFAMVASVMQSLGSFAEFMSKPPLKALTAGLVNSRWRSFMDNMRDAMVRDHATGGNQAMNGIRQRFPEFSGLVDVFSHELVLKIGADHLRPLERAMQDKDAAVAAAVRASIPR